MPAEYSKKYQRLTLMSIKAFLTPKWSLRASAISLCMPGRLRINLLKDLTNAALHMSVLIR
jgi:hypothetical protein